MRIKKAFTLGETCLVFIIIGIVASIGLSTVKPWQKSYKYSYSRMYNSLQLAIYNHMINSTESSSFPVTADKFCLALLEYINTSDNATTCHNDSSFLMYDATPTFSKDKVHINVSNGTRIWIGSNKRNLPFEITQTFSDGTNDTVKFYVVFVDINGERGPNTAVWSKNQMADIVAFVVTDKFNVLPIGYPQVDTRYLTAHVIYPSLNTDYTSGDDARYSGDEDVVSDPMTYYEAKIKAYGNTAFSGYLDTYSEFTNFFSISGCYGGYFKIAEPYSDYYTTLPTFDTASCALETGVSNQPVCTLKIYDYH